MSAAYLTQQSAVYIRDRGKRREEAAAETRLLSGDVNRKLNNADLDSLKVKHSNTHEVQLLSCKHRDVYLKIKLSMIKVKKSLDCICHKS